MKKAWKIARGVLVGLLLTVYVAVAAVNYSVVQSYLGAAAGRYFSSEWGGTVKIGALHAMPWDHLILNNVLLVSPDGDTLLDVQRLSAHFRKFPYSDMHLSVDRVSLRGGYYHLAVEMPDDSGTAVTNLQYIIDYYTQGKEIEPGTGVFTVDVGTLMVSRMRYKMDLPEIPDMDYPHGVQIAHMDFRDIACRAKDIHVENDDVSVRLIKFGCEERSGFRVNHVEGKVHVGPADITVTDFVLRTPRSEVMADVRMDYGSWERMEDYLNTVQHDITLKEGTSVALADAAYWAPMLWGADEQIEAQGHMAGTINDMTTDLMLHWGGQSGLMVAGTLRDITMPDSAVVDVDIERLWTRQADLGALFALMEPPESLMHLVQQVDYVDLGGRVKGGLGTASTVNMSLASGLGNLHLDAALTPRQSGGFVFDAEAGSSGMGLNLLQSDWLTHTGFDVSAVGIWSDPSDIGTLRASMDGHLLNSVVQGQRLAPIDLSGTLERGAGHVKVQSDDSLAQLTLVADFDLADTVKSAACDIAIAQLNTEAFRLMPEKYGRLKTHAVLIAEGRNLDTMSGELTLEGTELGAVRVSNAVLTVDADGNGKTLRLKSDPMDATVTGRFAYGDLPLMAKQIGNDLLPRELTHCDSLTAEEKEALRQSDIQMQLLWKDRGSLLHTIKEDLTVAYGTRLTASYSTGERLKTVLHSDHIGIGTVALDNIGLSGRYERDAYRILLESQEVNIGAIELLQRANMVLTTNPVQTRLEMLWGTDGSTSHGDVELQLADRRISVLKPDFTVGSTVWHLLIDSLALVDAGGIGLKGDGIAVRSDRQSATARLSLQGQRDDCVELNFDNFALAGLSDIFLQDSPVSIGGDIGGRFSIYGLNDIPYFNANLTIDSCEVNHQPLGEVQLRSNWNAELNILNLILASDQLAADGWLQLGKEDADINFTADFNSFNLGLAAPLLADFTSRFEGMLHGSFDITGTLTQPVVVGEALVEDGALQVDMTGVTYYFNDSIEFTNRKITLRDFRINDPQGNTAYVNGGILYDNINDLRLDLQLATDRLLVLDRQQGEEFYGTLLASAEGSVRGAVDALDIAVSARTSPGCKLTVPVNDQRQVQSQNYITFVGDRSESEPSTGTAPKEQKTTLNLDLTITPDVQLNLPMDFSEVKVGVGASGSGDLHLTLSGSGEPQVVGSYEIVSGTMKLGLLSLIEKTFSLESGSSLDFRGSLPDARFDLRAVYSQRVNLSTLTGSISDVGGTQKYIQVEDVIAIAGTLQEPTIGFDLRLPGADASVEEEVFAYIDRNSERDMLNQTVSLLVTGSFYNANGTGSSANGSIATSGGIGALSSLLTDMVSVVDIDVDYKMGNELTKDQVDVNISKDWGRWYLESTLGYGGESRELQTGDATSAVIDALVGYRLSPLVHLYAYNRTNTNDYTRMDLPYKQGVGLKLTKDFDRWTDLLKRNRTNKK